MITDEMLRKAAANSCEAYISALMGQDFSGCAVSQQMERKILRLARRADHADLYRFLRQAAILLLSALIGLSSWLTVDTQAREALFSWLREIGKNSIIYHSADGPSSDAPHTRYYLPAVPEGYSLYLSEEDEFGGQIIFQNNSGQYLKFYHLFNTDGSSLLVNRQNVKLSHTTVSGNPADLLISTDPKTASAIFWTTEDGTAFYVSAFLSTDDLIALAESVQIKQ